MSKLGCIKDKFDDRDYLMRAYLPVVKLPKKLVFKLWRFLVFILWCSLVFTLWLTSLLYKNIPANLLP